MSIKAVVFDLDDTLYPETDYVKSGFKEVGREIEKRFGIENAFQKLCDYFSLNKVDVYGRLLRDNGIAFQESDIADFVEIYRTHKPELTLSDEVSDVLSALRAKGYFLGIITDGRPFQQHAKIQALGLTDIVDEITITDELGGPEFRKPNPSAFEKMCAKFGIQPQEMLYVGDNPQKDFVIKKFFPIKTMRVNTKGLYCNREYNSNIVPDYVCEFEDILSVIDN